MAYNSSTNGATANVPQLLAPRMGSGVAVWLYNSAHSATDTFQTSRFITDAYYLGIRAGDLVINVGSSMSIGCVSSVTTAGATFLTANIVST